MSLERAVRAKVSLLEKKKKLSIRLIEFIAQLLFFV